MGKELITQKELPICDRCKINPCRKNGISKNGFIKYKKYCHSCNKIIYNIKENGRRLGYRGYKKDKCEICNFTPTHKCQLDVDHIDGDRTNDNESNFKTLCANCHRLKTYMNKNNEMEKRQRSYSRTNS